MTLPAVPGNDKSTSGFEGFANKEEGTGKSLFHAKHSVQPAGDQPAAIQGFAVNKRKGGKTSAAFVKKIGD